MESNSTKLALISRFLRLELLSLSCSPLAKVKADTGGGLGSANGMEGWHVACGYGRHTVTRTHADTQRHKTRTQIVVVRQVTPANNDNAHTATQIEIALLLQSVTVGVLLQLHLF